MAAFLIALLVFALLFALVAVPMLFGRLIGQALVSRATALTTDRMRKRAEQDALLLSDSIAHGGSGLAFSHDREHVLLANGQVVRSYPIDQLVSMASSTTVRRNVSRWLIDLTVRDEQQPVYRISFPDEATWLRWSGLLELAGDERRGRSRPPLDAA